MLQIKALLALGLGGLLAMLMLRTGLATPALDVTGTPIYFPMILR